MILFFILFQPAFSMFGDIESFRISVETLRRALKIGPVRVHEQTQDVGYIPLSNLEYPGKNVEKLIQIKKLWDIYYDCLQYQYKARESFMHPIAIPVYEGSAIHLNCLFCISPAQGFGSIHWYYHKTLNSTPLEIEETNNIIIDQNDTLNIYNIQAENAGIYYCSSVGTKTIAYFVHVFDDNEPLIQIRYNETKKGLEKTTFFVFNKTEEDYVIELENYKGIFITIVWSDWNMCTRCGQIGRRSKYGFCFVISRGFSKGKDPRFNEAFGLFEYFNRGLPCRSPLLPEWIKNEKTVQETTNKIILGYCNETCENNIFDDIDANGIIIDTANNSEGVYSPFQLQPRIYTQVGRITYYAEIGSNMTIKCPKSENMDVIYDWYIDKKRIFYIQVGKNQTIYVDPRGRLFFSSIQENDKGFYTCWQKKEITGIVTIVPVEAYFIKVDRHAVLIGTLTILVLFVFLFVKIILLKEKARAGKRK